MPYFEIKGEYPIPSDPTILSRYYLKEKFVSFIETSNLYLTQIEKFKNDEIIFSLIDKQMIREKHKNLGRGNWREDADIEIKNFEALRYCSYLNCWTTEYLELRKFWEKYGESKDSVMIRTSAKKLKQEIHKSGFNVYLARVTYYDPISDPLGKWNTIKMVARKPNDFIWEQEARIVISRFLKKEVFQNHLEIEIDVSALIDEIIISPFASEGYLEEVQKLVSNRGINAKIIKPSTINLH